MWHNECTMNELNGLGKKSRGRLSLLLRKTNGTVSVEQTANILKLSPKESAILLARWAKQGWLYRVQRGLYVPIPLDSLSGEIAVEDPWIIANTIFNPCYIGGWSAAEYWDLTEQIFKSIVVITSKKLKKRKLKIAGIDFYLKSTYSKFLFGTKIIWRGKNKIQVSDPTRTIVDMLNDPKLGGGIRPVNDILKVYLKSKYRNLNLFIDYADRLENRTVFKRFGFLIEKTEPDEKDILRKCLSRLSKGNSKLDPDLKTTRLVTKWKLWVPESWLKGLNND